MGVPVALDSAHFRVEERPDLDLWVAGLGFCCDLDRVHREGQNILPDVYRTSVHFLQCPNNSRRRGDACFASRSVLDLESHCETDDLHVAFLPASCAAFLCLGSTPRELCPMHCPGSYRLLLDVNIYSKPKAQPRI